MEYSKTIIRGNWFLYFGVRKMAASVQGVGTTIKWLSKFEWEMTESWWKTKRLRHITYTSLNSKLSQVNIVKHSDVFLYSVNDHFSSFNPCFRQIRTAAPPSKCSFVT